MEHLYLVHHGILGQKWGKRNGPPYPLGQSDKSAAEKRAEKKQLTEKTKDDTVEDKENKKLHLTDKQKKAIKIGAAVAGTALVAIGGYQLYKSGKLDGLIDLGKKALDNSEAVEQAGKLDKSALDKITEKTGLRQTGFRLTPSQTATVVGDERREVLRNAGPGEALGWANNCAHASMAYILNRMGFDTKPEPVDFLNGHEDVRFGTEMDDLFDIFDSPRKVTSIASSEEQLKQAILGSYGNVEGSYGIIGGSHKEGSKYLDGHAFVWENVGGTIELHNPQDESKMAVVRTYMDGWYNNYSFTRLDGCDLNTNYRNQGDPDLVYDRLKTIVSNA